MPASAMSSHALGEFVDLGEEKIKIDYLQFLCIGLRHDGLIDSRAQCSLRSVSLYQASKEMTLEMLNYILSIVRSDFCKPFY